MSQINDNWWYILLGVIGALIGSFLILAILQCILFSIAIVFYELFVKIQNFCKNKHTTQQLPSVNQLSDPSIIGTQKRRRRIIKKRVNSNQIKQESTQQPKFIEFTGDNLNYEIANLNHAVPVDDPQTKNQFKLTQHTSI